MNNNHSSMSNNRNNSKGKEISNFLFKNKKMNMSNRYSVNGGKTNRINTNLNKEHMMSG